MSGNETITKTATSEWLPIEKYNREENGDGVVLFAMPSGAVLTGYWSKGHDWRGSTGYMIDTPVSFARINKIKIVEAHVQFV